MPAYADALNAYKAGDYRRAMTLVDALRAAAPRDLRVRSLHAMLLARASRLDDAERELTAVIDDCPDEKTAFGVRHQLALVHLQQRRIDDALTQIDLALQTQPLSPVLIAAKADILATAGRTDDAATLVERAIAKVPPNLPLAILHARFAARAGRPDDGLEPLQTLTAAAPPSMETMRALRQLAELYERLDRYDVAFDALARAGAMSPVRYDARSAEALVDRLLDVWTTDAIRAAPRAGIDTDAPVLIVGMPRSGTSLTEQILASHPHVAAVGESDTLSEAAALHLGAADSLWRAKPMAPDKLTPEAVRAAAEHYKAAVLDPVAPAARVTDKHPMNFWRLGLVPLLFPNARVIHCVRDPRDTCLSCWAQHFVTDHPWANRLEDLAHFYRQYHRLTAHWERVLTALAVSHTRAVYEDTVANQETETRRLIDFLGLDWDDACLRFHESDRVVYTHSNEQVRRPMYTSSVGRWRHYAAHLEPLTNALADLVPPAA
ncbi:MAG: sulfotransferase [Phycisphaerales bacterium]